MTGRKMSGKYCCEVHFSDPDCPCTKRIAELESLANEAGEAYKGASARAEKAEAELDAYRGTTFEECRIRMTRAEAEVERLRAVCDSQNLLVELYSGAARKERDDG